MTDDWMPPQAKPARRAALIEDDPLNLSSDALSLEGLQAVYRNPSLPLAIRMRAMGMAIPYESPKLQMIANVDEKSFANLLEQRLKRIEEQRKLIDQKPHNDGSSPIETKPALPRVPDRRYRRI